ncbi:MAG TPA: SPOR domain-containing protein [Stellaceae bacterium]|nr:SPOR domain-containing protein [Stellaceae bacterium]
MSFRLELEPEDLRPDRGGATARRWGMVFGAVAMVMLGSAAGLWAAYHVIGGHGSSATVPIIRADERPVKVPPANPGGMKVPDQNMYILNRDRPVDSRVEQLLPPPETPLPRPTPPASVVTETPPPAPPASALAQGPASVPVPAPAPRPSPTVSALPPPAVPATIAAPVSAAVDHMPSPAAASEAVRKAAATGAGYRLQVGAMRSPEAARLEWKRLQRLEHDVLGGFGETTERVNDGRRGVFYRIIAGPVADAAAAEHACGELKRRKVGCIIVKP